LWKTKGDANEWHLLKPQVSYIAAFTTFAQDAASC
jgi:hypothetical protein